MAPKVQEIQAKTLVSRSRIPGIDFVINPYRGCAFGCRYCYADFIRKFRDGDEAWGAFVDVKANAPALIWKEIRRIPPGKRVLLSSVTDPYQPLERNYRLTRRILEVLRLRPDLEVRILTRSPLVTRDVDLFRELGPRLQVGLSITTDREEVRKLFEPTAPAIPRRLQALRTLHEAGIRTFAFLGPLLPCSPRNLARLVAPHADRVLVDQLNYPWKVEKLLKAHGMGYILSPRWFHRCVEELRSVLGDKLEEV